jgi:hypothetical protein
VVGDDVGLNVGDAVGAAEGLNDGAPVGLDVGTAVGGSDTYSHEPPVSHASVHKPDDVSLGW